MGTLLKTEMESVFREQNDRVFVRRALYLFLSSTYLEYSLISLTHNILLSHPYLSFARMLLECYEILHTRSNTGTTYIPDSVERSIFSRLWRNIWYVQIQRYSYVECYRFMSYNALMWKMRRKKSRRSRARKTSFGFWNKIKRTTRWVYILLTGNQNFMTWLKSYPIIQFVVFCKDMSIVRFFWKDTSFIYVPTCWQLEISTCT